LLSSKSNYNTWSNCKRRDYLLLACRRKMWSTLSKRFNQEHRNKKFSRTRKIWWWWWSRHNKI